MSELVLTRGNCNYSSWSMRAWLALRLAGASFEQEQLWLEEDRDRGQRLARSPAGRVPVLRDGRLIIWDSLAIAEYLAERFPDAGLWPADVAARARARSLCCEMHSGFSAIRERLPLNCRARKPHRDRGPEVRAEVARVSSMWAETRGEFGSRGSYLFGEPCLADAFYAPVASRFRTYGVELAGAAAAYQKSVLAWAPVAEWSARAEREGHPNPAYDDLD